MWSTNTYILESVPRTEVGGLCTKKAEWVTLFCNQAIIELLRSLTSRLGKTNDLYK